jgi:protein-tyrosine phosphatase
MPERILQLDHVYNFRDLGGYPTRAGTTTRWGRFFRSAALQNLTDEARARLRGLDLRTIIDLRRTDEIEGEPDAVAGEPSFRYYHLPIFPAPLSSAEHSPLPQVTSLADVYIAVLDHFGGPVKAIFERLVESSANPVLIHCTAGKDRTGVIAALLLDLARVPAEVIITDYAMTEALVAPLMNELRQKAILTGLDIDRHSRMLECKPEYMDAMLSHLYARYGDAEAYLRHIGIGGPAIESLKTALLD